MHAYNESLAKSIRKNITQKNTSSLLSSSRIIIYQLKKKRGEEKAAIAVKNPTCHTNRLKCWNAHH